MKCFKFAMCLVSVLAVALLLPGCAIFDSAKPTSGFSIDRTYQANKDGSPLVYKDEDDNTMFAEILQREKLSIDGDWLKENRFSLDRSQDTNKIDLFQSGDGNNAYKARVSDNQVTVQAMQNVKELGVVIGKVAIMQDWLGALSKQNSQQNELIKFFGTPREDGSLPDASILRGMRSTSIPMPDISTLSNSKNSTSTMKLNREEIKSILRELLEEELK